MNVTDLLYLKVLATEDANIFPDSMQKIIINFNFCNTAWILHIHAHTHTHINCE